MRSGIPKPVRRYGPSKHKKQGKESQEKKEVRNQWCSYLEVVEGHTQEAEYHLAPTYFSTDL